MGDDFEELAELIRQKVISRRALVVSDEEVHLDEEEGTNRIYVLGLGASAVFSRIEEKIKEATRILERLGYKTESISPEEFYDYMTGETPSGDIVTLDDVLRNEFLMVHEAVEVSELKKMGVPISRQTVMSFHPKVYEAHFTATDYELTYASEKGDYGWLRRRLAHAEDWLGDDYLPQELIPRCKSIIERFSRHL